jgi:hypothetical protein
MHVQAVIAQRLVEDVDEAAVPRLPGRPKSVGHVDVGMIAHDSSVRTDNSLLLSPASRPPIIYQLRPSHAGSDPDSRRPHQRWEGVMSPRIAGQTRPLFASLRRAFALTAVLGMSSAFSAYALDKASGAAGSDVPLATVQNAPTPEAATSSSLSAPPGTSATLATPMQHTASVPPSAAAPGALQGQNSTPQEQMYRVRCEYVVTREYLNSFVATVAESAISSAAPGAAAPPKERKYPDPTGCPVLLPKDARVLDGPGDLVVVVNAAGYSAALAASSATKPLRLFLNGFDLGTDGLIAGAERRGEWVALRFHVPNGKYSQPFWTTVYNQQGILDDGPLQASVGWSVEPAFVPDDKTQGDPLYVSVTNWRWLTAASFMAALLTWFFFWALWGTDTFRLAPTYPWWSDARSLQTKLHRATVPLYLWPFQLTRKVTVDTNDKTIAAILKGYYSNFDPAKVATYQEAAGVAKSGAVPTDVAQAVVGLALTSDWRTFRLPFSLARVQWGSWMTFATTVAVFLWLVYARFPILEGSVLGLIAVSTLTAGASLIIENGSDKKNTAYSKGFFYDIMTDMDGVQQAHRYQAIVVNTLLFAVGLLYVWQHLAYPTFDTSWLELLGLSGFAQAAGKGTLEQK